MPQAKQSPPNEELLTKLREENTLLKSRLSETRETLQGYRTQLDKQNRAVFQHSRLIRILERLQVPLPKHDDDYLSPQYQKQVNDATASKADVARAESQRDVALEVLRLLLGATQVTIDENEDDHQPIVRFMIKNEQLGREMCFTIGWDDKKIEYNRISILVDQEAAPQFADEHCIVFDFQQGPFFLAEVLKAVHDVQFDKAKDD